MAKKDINNDKQKNNFSKELKAEMKKVTWPTLKELVNSTSAVIAIVIIVATIVFVLDVCFENLNKFGVEKLKSVVSTDTQTTEETEKIEGSDENIQLVTDEDTNTESEENVEIIESDVTENSAEEVAQ